MRACSDPCGAVIIFGRVGFDEGNEILHSARRERFVDRQHYHCGGGDRDRIEIPDRIIGNSVVKAWICCECNSIDDKDRIAVRRRLRRATRADIAARAGHILDVELLAEPLGQLLCDKPPDRVSLTAGRKRHDNAHWPGRVRLRPRNARDRWQRGSARGQTEKISAGKFHHVAFPERLCSRRSAAHYSHCESVWMSVYGPSRQLFRHGNSVASRGIAVNLRERLAHLPMPMSIGLGWVLRRHRNTNALSARRAGRRESSEQNIGPGNENKNGTQSRVSEGSS